MNVNSGGTPIVEILDTIHGGADHAVGHQQHPRTLEEVHLLLAVNDVKIGDNYVIPRATYQPNFMDLT